MAKAGDSCIVTTSLAWRTKTRSPPHSKKRANLILDSNEDNAPVVVLTQEIQRSNDGHMGAMITRTVNGDSNSHPKGQKKGRQLPLTGIVCLSTNSYSPAPGNLLATIVARRTNMVTDGASSRCRLDSQRWSWSKNRVRDACHAWKGISCSAERP